MAFSARNRVSRLANTLDGQRSTVEGTWLVQLYTLSFSVLALGSP